MSRYNTKGLTIIQSALLIGYGIASCYVPILVTVLWIAIFFITVFALFKDRQEWIWYCIAASPMLEVWSRMVKGVVLMDEVGKYYLLLAILCIFIYQRRQGAAKPQYNIGAILFFCVLPSLFVNLSTFNSEQWVFNILSLLELSALLTLATRERWDIERFARTLQFGLMPIAFVVIYMVYKNPSLSGVNFTLGANFDTAAGGTNQVATVLGMSILFIMLLLLLKRPIVSIKWISYVLLAYLFFRSFLTFSRGGVFAAIVCVVIAVGFASSANAKTFIRNIAILVGFVIVGAIIFTNVDAITNNLLSQRYRGETIATISGEQEKTWNKVTSGRSSLIKADLNIFKDNFLFGVGPGGAKEYRTQYGAPPDSAAHTEVTRLMSEHGLGGLLAALAFLLFPIYWIRRQRYRLWMGVTGALFCMAILTSSHSATRTNTMAVCYTLASIPVFVRTQKKREQEAQYNIHRQ
ncbi:MAG: O-antigen ligase family protein [Chitinophagales bacterium]|nr:O-antigen ligase family protein [Chitinophagaceae bacterium]MCB9065395.1 O-antigen ligase family protein [Chitinophagales bacterium]